MAEGVEAGASPQVDIVGHVVDHPYIELPFVGHGESLIAGRVDLPSFAPVLGVDLSITRHLVVMWIASALLVGLLMLAFRRGRAGPSRLAGFFEVIILFVRDGVGYPVMGEGGRPFLPFILTIFFFILFCNLIGLIPYSATPTGNISVTAGLAIVSFFATQIAGISSHGLRGHLRNLVPGDVPLPVKFILVPIELITLVARPFALCIRLFANMLSGHVAILVLLGLIIMIGNALVAPASVIFAVGLYFFELAIAFVQAFVFALLTTMFVHLAYSSSH